MSPPTGGTSPYRKHDEHIHDLAAHAHLYACVLKNTRYMAWSRFAQHRAAVLWKKWCTSVARSFFVRSSLRVTCQAQLTPFTRLYRQCTCHCPPQLIRGPSNPWTFTCSWSTRGVDRGSATVSRPSHPPCTGQLGAGGSEIPPSYLEIARESEIPTIYRLSERKLSDTNNCHSRFSISAHRQDTIHVWD